MKLRHVLLVPSSGCASPRRRPSRSPGRTSCLILVASLALGACVPEDDPDGVSGSDARQADDAVSVEEATSSRAERASASLGPADGHDLPAVDLDRVQVGDTAPDFTLESYDGDLVSLSDFRGEKNVVLVFYRGFW